MQEIYRDYMSIYSKIKTSNIKLISIEEYNYYL